MTLKGHTLKSQSELARHICSGAPTFYHSSRTSTVIPYEVLEEAFGANPPEIADLGHIPGKMKIIDGVLELSGAVTWKEAKAFCQAQGFSGQFIVDFVDDHLLNPPEVGVADGIQRGKLLLAG
ncbi:MAG: hypothetical protein HN509_05425, partial [Halobacteriovoraceae bacterium]|nr:hypothetical protein [Halobacteriovoraceae bacterium]